MSVLRKFPRLMADTFAAPKALLSRMKHVVDRHSAFLENIEGEDGIEIRRNAMGGITIGGGGEGGAESGTWSGIVWWIGLLKWDFSKISANPAGEDLAGGLQSALEGVYLKVKLSDGSTEWDDEIGDDTDEWNYYPVAVAAEVPETDPQEYTYSLSTGRVVGDIRIDMVPFHAPLEDAPET